MTECMLLYAFLWITSTNYYIPGLFAFFPPRYSCFLVFFFSWVFLEVRVYTANFLNNSGGMDMHNIYLSLLIILQNTLHVLFHVAFVTIKEPIFQVHFLQASGSVCLHEVHWWTITTSAACTWSFCDKIISVKQVQPVSTRCNGLSSASNSVPCSSSFAHTRPHGGVGIRIGRKRQKVWIEILTA